MSTDQDGLSTDETRIRLMEERPARLVLPALPSLDRTALEARSLSGIKPYGWFTKPTTLEEADQSCREVRDEHLARHEGGDRRALRDLLELAREYAGDPLVAEAVVDLLLSEGHVKRKRGRPAGSSPRVLETALGIVRVVQGLNETTGIKPERILRAMAENDFEALSDTLIRHRYYRFRRHPSLRPFLFTREGPRRVFPARERDAAHETFVIRSITVMVGNTLATVRNARFVCDGNNVTLALEMAMPSKR